MTSNIKIISISIECDENPYFAPNDDDCDLCAESSSNAAFFLIAAHHLDCDNPLNLALCDAHLLIALKSLKSTDSDESLEHLHSLDAMRIPKY